MRKLGERDETTLSLSNNAPIGVFDSGVGGLTVIRALEKAMPNESFIYYGDTAHVPYGPRDPEEIKYFALQIGRYLEKQGCKLLLIACNTSTALAYDMLRQALSIPVVGVIEPAVDKVCGSKGAGSLHEEGNGSAEPPVGVIATQAAVISGAFQKMFTSRQPHRPVYMMACPAFVPLVEAGITEGPQVEAAVKEYLAPLKEKGIRTLIMGCTHYPFLADAFRVFLGAEVDLLDPAIETVRRGREILAGMGLLADNLQPQRRFVSSGDPEQFRKGASLFLDQPIERVEQVVL